MPSPFPGMDPNLEHPALWPDVHNKLISEAQTYLNRLIRPKYVARVEARRYVSADGDPGRAAISPAFPDAYLIDKEINETYLTIQEPRSDRAITVIEFLSHTNKIKNAAGYKSLFDHRKKASHSESHWVEIDLLRSGERTQARLPQVPFDYLAIVARANRDDRAECWLFGVQQALPTIGIPLKVNEPDVSLQLSSLLQIAYDEAGYDAHVDYAKPPVPPLSPADEEWANQLLRKKGLRLMSASNRVNDSSTASGVA